MRSLLQSSMTPAAATVVAGSNQGFRDTRVLGTMVLPVDVLEPLSDAVQITRSVYVDDTYMTSRAGAQELVDNREDGAVGGDSSVTCADPEDADAGVASPVTGECAAAVPAAYRDLQSCTHARLRRPCQDHLTLTTIAGFLTRAPQFLHMCDR